MSIVLPRFVDAKRLASGAMAYYWHPPAYWKKQAKLAGRRFPFQSAPLGTDLSATQLAEAAAVHNLAFDEWRTAGGHRDGPGRPPAIRRYGAHGSVAWLLESYLASEMFKRRVAERSRADYRRLLGSIVKLPTALANAPCFGDLPIASVTPAAAEVVYAKMIEGQKFRRGEKAMMYLKTVWKVMQPHHPSLFRKDVPNPWPGVQRVKWKRETKVAHGRDDVYVFAEAAIAMNYPELAAAAVICFEWLHRPENVLAGYVRWPDYVPRRQIRMEHRKTGENTQHPLVDADGEPFYADAEAILAQVPRRGVPIVLRADGTLYEPTRCAQLVRKVANAAGLPKSFTLDSCRHGGMTELEEAGLTDGQGRALSAHRSRAYEGYAKRTEKRMLAATRRRHAYVAGGG